jgi:hypothetical protein
MAQSVVAKRRNIASNAVIQATVFYDALRALSDLSAERAELGDFVQTDFDGTDLEHLTPFVVGSLLDIVVPAIRTFVDVTDATRKHMLLQMRR